MQESITTFGCTTPYGRNIDYICTDFDKAESAYTLYEKKMRGVIAECLRPCQYMKVSGTKFNVFPGNMIEPRIHIYFDELVKVSQTYITYTSLEMLAEVGGYVGLFLGVSVYHFKDLFNYILNKICA